MLKCHRAGPVCILQYSSISLTYTQTIHLNILPLILMLLPYHIHTFSILRIFAICNTRANLSLSGCCERDDKNEMSCLISLSILTPPSYRTDKSLQRIHLYQNITWLKLDRMICCSSSILISATINTMTSSYTSGRRDTFREVVNCCCY